MKQFTRIASALAVAGGLSLAAGTANAAIIDFLFDNTLGPDTSTSGTSQPRNEAGRVYTGSSRRPSRKDSVTVDSGLPRTPGNRREIPSRTTSAAASPPAMT